MRVYQSFKVNCARLMLACLAAAALCQAVNAQPNLDLPAYLSDFVLTKSDFNTDLNFGKDPFFPKSIRRHGQRPINNTPPIIPDAPITELKLNGTSGSIHRPLAIINNRTFAVGETAEMRVNNQVAKVTLVEINEKVVKITVNGQPKELPRAQK